MSDIKKRPRGPNGISHVLPNGLYYLWKDWEDGRVTLAQDVDPLKPHGEPGFTKTFCVREEAHCAVDELQTMPPLLVSLEDPILPLLREAAGALAARDGHLGRTFYNAFNKKSRWEEKRLQEQLTESDERLLVAIRALRAELSSEHDKTGGEE